MILQVLPPDGLSKGLRGQTLWMSRAPKGAERATNPHHMPQQFEIISFFFGFNIIKPLQIVIQPSEISVISAM